MLFDLTGKTIVITGGYSPLGTAMAEALYEFGANVVIAGRNQEKALATAKQIDQKGNKNRCEGFCVDVSNEQSVQELFQAVMKRVEKIDGVVNNAAYAAASRVEEQSLEDFKHGLDGTINPVFTVTSQALSYFIPAGAGNIVNISSMYGVVSCDPHMYEGTGCLPSPADYAAGKAAIIQFTKYIACHYADKGIRANCISPGTFPAAAAQQNELFMQRLSKKNPMGRVGRPEEIKGIIVLLCSDASSYITGQNICVDGGWTAW